jgi:uncharacterized membrane protein YkvA (DUF1232 family)
VSYLLSGPSMLILGLLTHFLMILSEMSTARKVVVTPWGYLKEKPYKAALSVIGSIVAYSLLPENAEPYIVFGAGYMANDALDRIGTIANKSMTRTIVVNEKGETVKERLNDETIITYAHENEALDRPSEVPRD